MSNDNITPECAGNCLLDNLPTSPTKTQLKLISNYQIAWLVPAAVIPFTLLVLIGGWGGTFESGDASAYMVGAIIVCVTESIFQQRDGSFEILKKRWRERNSACGMTNQRGRADGSTSRIGRTPGCPAAVKAAIPRASSSKRAKQT
jgi:hypothetical protein